MTKNKLTRAEFMQRLTENASIIAAAPRRRTAAEFDKKIERYIAHMNYLDYNAEKRTAEAATNNRIRFSNGSIFEFAHGKNELTEYTNDAGIRFLVVKNTYTDEWDGVDYSNYIVYILVAAENSEAERSYESFEIVGAERNRAFRSALKRNGYKYEASGIMENITHYSVYCSKKEVEILLNIA